MSKVSLDTIKPWISQRITKILGIEDDVVIEFIFNMLENEQVAARHLIGLFVLTLHFSARNSTQTQRSCR